MTILYALEKLNDNDEWTRMHTLTIHTCQDATWNEWSFSTLKFALIFCLVSPQVSTKLHGSECQQLGRKRIHENAPYTYHGFVQKKGSDFEKPDLCIAFNSGASQASMHTWPATFQLLVERKIPSLFTSLNREEAELEAALLRAAGAILHPGLGPVKNPWGSINATSEPIKVYGHYAVNGWLAGGFR
ncbi:hypothetical protein DFH08DRAFT_807295 [Mycena albidolilacea]|uniref:Mitochondrial splicing suppressor 51-like C-terminal domain-containing protein n=1 Tax=Mycena albidolilacea TaxID=1033008 RepID=A0AAD7A5Q7_9AGAR|nr:hypothetical protein DFH08DRAFT_807295 [Mycena albidolilacea]